MAAETEQEMSQSDRWRRANSSATGFPAETASGAQRKLRDGHICGGMTLCFRTCVCQRGAHKRNFHQFFYGVFKCQVPSLTRLIRLKRDFVLCSCHQCPNLQRTRLSQSHLGCASITVWNYNGTQPLQGQSQTLTRL